MIICSTLQSRPSLENGGITGPVFTIEHLAPFVPVVHGHGREGLKELRECKYRIGLRSCEESPKKWHFVSKIVLTFCEKKNVQVIEKNLLNSRLKAKNLQIF